LFSFGGGIGPVSSANHTRFQWDQVSRRSPDKGNIAINIFPGTTIKIGTTKKGYTTKKRQSNNISLYFLLLFI